MKKKPRYRLVRRGIYSGVECYLFVRDTALEGICIIPVETFWGAAVAE